MVMEQRLVKWLKSLSGRLVLSALLIHLLLIPMLFGAVFQIINTALYDQFVNEVRTLSGLLASQITPINPAL